MDDHYAHNSSSTWEVLSEVVTPEGVLIRTTAMFVGTGSLVHVVSSHQDGHAVENLEFVPGVEVSYIEDQDESGLMVIVGRELAPIGEEYEDD